MNNEELIVGENYFPIDMPEVEEGSETELSKTEAYMNVFNPWFGVKHGTGLSSTNPSEKSWDPETTDWVQKLSPNEKLVVANANSEEYAMEKLKRLDLYNQSAREIADDPWAVKIPMALGTGMLDPTILIPVGVTANATKAAYTLGAKATRLGTIMAESAVVGMSSATLNLAAEKGSGYGGDQEYVSTNIYAGLLSGGLPFLGSMLSSSYETAKVAKYLSSDSKEFIQVATGLSVEKTGSTQAKTWYNKYAPQWLKSDVSITAEHDNPFITLVSNRMDRPAYAVVDRNTGKPVPIKNTGHDYKDRLFGKQQTWKAGLNTFRRDSQFKDEDAFNLEVGKTIRDRANRQELEIYNRINDEMVIREREIREEYLKTKSEIPEGTSQEAIDEILHKNENTIRNKLEREAAKRKQELYDEVQLDFKHSDEFIVKAAQHTDDLYKQMLQEGKRLKSKELANISENRHYMTRIFDFQRVRQTDLDELTNTLHKALVSHPANRSMSPEELSKQAKDIAQKLKDLDYSKEFADYSFMVPKEAGITSFLRNRQFKFDERVLGDLLVTNVNDVVGQYMYKQSGHLAVLHAFPELQGIPVKDQLDVFRQKFIEPLREVGNAKRDGDALKALENQFLELTGMFRIAKNGNSISWKAARLGNAFNSLTFGGAFALNTAAETGSLVLSGKIKNVMKARLGSLKEIRHMFNNKGIEDPLVKDMILAGTLQQLFEYKGMMRMADTEGVFDASKLEHTVTDLNNAFFKYNFLRGATTALEALAGPKVIHDILDLSKKATWNLSDMKYMARIGLDQDTVNKIGTYMKQHSDFQGGKILDIKLGDWGDDETADMLLSAISNGVKQTVIQGDTRYLPSKIIDPNTSAGPFVRMFTNMLRYPLAATETLMVRGMDEDMAKYIAGTMTSVFMMSSVVYLREAAAIEAGLIEESEAKFQNFWEDEEAAFKLFSSSLGKAGTLGGGSIFLDKLSAMSGVPTPGSEYARGDVLAAVLGPTFSRIPAMRDILEPVLTEGNFQDRKTWYALKSLTPAATLPFLNEYLTTQIKENTY